MPRREAMRLLAAALAVPALPRAASALEARGADDAMANQRALLDKWVGPGRLPGMAMALGLPGRDAEYALAGTQGFLDADPVTPDTLFRIYSMTKPVTGMAAMILIDEGKLGLDQPVADILPRYARMQVQRTYDGSITDLVPSERAITVRHLLTHTSGLGYGIIQKGPIKAALEKAGLTPGLVTRLDIPGLSRTPAVRSLALFADRLAEIPLVHQPGTKWEYGLGLDLMGRIVEVVAGTAFDDFLRERLFDPCGMDSTFFQVPAREASRLATNHGVFDGIFVPIDKGEGSVYLDPPAFPFGGSGLVSSPRDYDRFLRMLAQGGELGGRRVMRERAVRLGTGDLLPDGIDTAGTLLLGGGFGAGGRVGKGREAGIFGWAGAAGTIGAVDMVRGIRAGFYAQFMPPDSLPLMGEYQNAVRADVMAISLGA